VANHLLITVLCSFWVYVFTSDRLTGIFDCCLQNGQHLLQLALQALVEVLKLVQRYVTELADGELLHLRGLAVLSVYLHTHTHPLVNGPLSRTTRVSRYQKGKSNLDFTEARDGEWQWHQLGYMQICTLLQTDNHASTPPLSFLQAGCPSCRPTNSVKALKASVYLSQCK